MSNFFVQNFKKFGAAAPFTWFKYCSLVELVTCGPFTSIVLFSFQNLINVILEALIFYPVSFLL